MKEKLNIKMKINLWLKVIVIFFPILFLKAQDMNVPVNVQVPLILKLLTFDRTLNTNSSNSIVIGILYQSKYRFSSSVKDEFLSTVADMSLYSIGEIDIHYIPINFDDENEFLETISKKKFDVFYICPLRALSIKKILSVSRSKKILTLSGIVSYVYEGAGVGIDVKGDKPLILINLNSVKEEGAELASQLLKLAKIIE